MSRVDRCLGWDHAVEPLQASQHQPHAVGSPYLPEFTLEKGISRKKGTCFPEMITKRARGVTGGVEDFDRGLCQFQRLPIGEQQIWF